MNNLLFISVFNYGGIELAKNHLESLKHNNISNYIAYVTDDNSYDELIRLNYKVSKYNSSNDVISKEKSNFATSEFNSLSYIRYNIINNLLKQNKAVWYLDIDTVVLTDLNKFYNSLNLNIDIDMVFQNDINMLCTGCMLIMPNLKTIHFTEFIYSIKNKNNNDQVLVNNIIRTNNMFNINILNENQFPNGLLYFNDLKEEPFFREFQEKFNKSNEPVYLVHANFMVGIQTKIESLKKKNLWYI